MRRFLISTAATVLLTLALVVPVAAAPGTTPNGFIGACNMVQAWPGVGHVPEGGGMENAMTVNNPNGNLGMDRAVSVSGGSC